MVYQSYEAKQTNRYNYAYYLIQVVSFRKEINFIYRSDKGRIEEMDISKIKEVLKNQIGEIEIFSYHHLQSWEKDQFINCGVPNITMMTQPEIFCLTA